MILRLSVCKVYTRSDFEIILCVYDEQNEKKSRESKKKKSRESKKEELLIASDISSMR